MSIIDVSHFSPHCPSQPGSCPTHTQALTTLLSESMGNAYMYLSSLVNQLHYFLYHAFFSSGRYVIAIQCFLRSIFMNLLSMITHAKYWVNLMEYCDNIVGTQTLPLSLEEGKQRKLNVINTFRILFILDKTQVKSCRAQMHCRKLATALLWGCVGHLQNSSVSFLFFYKPFNFSSSGLCLLSNKFGCLEIIWG